MRKEDLSTIKQLLVKISKVTAKFTIWGLFFLLRFILCYHLCRWAHHSHWSAIFSGFILACGSDLIHARKTH